jgi:hypothetical protein
VKADAPNYSTGPGTAAGRGFRRGSPGKQQTSERKGSELGGAIVGVGPDDSLEDRDSTRTEDVGLPEHERDETRRHAGTTGEDDSAEVANMSDAGLSEPGLPPHEDDARRAQDTGTGEQNP